MHRNGPSRALLSCALAALAGLLVAHSACAQDAPVRPRLAEALRAALAVEPPDSVEERIAAVLDSGEFAYEFDPDEVSALGAEYVRNGELDKARVVMGLAVCVAHAQMVDVLPSVPGARVVAPEASSRFPRRRRSGSSGP